jgi:heptaprenyl diphosphate synthase
MKYLELAGLSEDMLQVEENLREFLDTGERSHALSGIIREQLEIRGKRLRPLLVLLSGRLGDPDPRIRRRLCKIAALIEMVHMASLIHDDIVDDSPLRRGRPSVQAKYGKDMAVYAGDFFLSRIVQILMRENLTETGIQFGRTVESMCWGEIGQLAGYFDTSMTADRYLENIYGKTVAVCELACVSGGREGGCSDAVVEQLLQLGNSFGFMFQIRDDLLDFLSEEHMEGKPVHEDLREGVLTLPVLCALQREENRGQLTGLIEIFHRGEGTDEDMRQLDILIRQSGGMKQAIRIMENYGAAAERSIRQLPECEAREALEAVIQMLRLPNSIHKRGSVA